MRTSTSVMVAARPSMLISPPVNPPGRFTLQRSVEASLANNRSRCGNFGRARWKLHVDAEPHVVAARRHLPQDVISFRAGLT